MNIPKTILIVASVIITVLAYGCANANGGKVERELDVPKLAGVEKPDSGILIHEDGRHAVIFDKGYVFAVEAPEGWELERMYTDAFGEFLVFYPEGGYWSASDAVMYVRADEKHPGFTNIQQAIVTDTESFEANSPGVYIRPGESLKTYDGLNTAEVRLFDYTYYDAVAYIEEEKAIVFIVLNARSKGLFEESFPSYKSLVGSFYYMGEELKVK